MEDHGSPALRKLLEALPEAVRDTHARLGDATARVEASEIDYLGEEPRFEVVYHLYSLQHGQRLRVKARVPEEPAEIDSLAELWASANWMEREVWDLYGIRFRGHPDLRRILLYEEFEGHPLRKDYPKERRQPLVGPRN